MKYAILKVMQRELSEHFLSVDESVRSRFLNKENLSSKAPVRQSRDVTCDSLPDVYVTDEFSSEVHVDSHEAIWLLRHAARVKSK